MIEPGIYYKMPAVDYHSLDGYLSNSYLSRLNICPASAKIKEEETDAMRLGTAFHSLVLDGPEKFYEDCTSIPDDAPKRPTITQINAKKPSDDTRAAIAWWNAFDEANKKKTIISKSDHATILEMREAINQHPIAAALIATPGESEINVFWEDTFSGLPCRARMDKRMCDKLTVLDLKSCADASPRGFQQSAIHYGYVRQAAFYSGGIKKVTGQDHLFCFIAVEKKPPYRVGVYTFSEAFIDYGRTEIKMLIALEMRCRERNHWPNYTSVEPVELELPKYLAYREG